MWPVGRPIRIRRGALADQEILVPVFSTGSGYRDGYEGHTESVLEALGRALDQPVIYDIGAHVGFISLLAERHLQGCARIHAVEPMPAAFGCLAYNLSRLCVSHFRLHNVAVGDQVGSAKMEGFDGGVRAHVEAAAGSEAGNVVRETTVDHMVFEEAEDRPDLIKCDVEGFEMHVLRGAERVLDSVAPIWLLEYHSSELRRAVYALFVDKGYDCYLVTGHHSFLALPRCTREVWGDAAQWLVEHEHIQPSTAPSGLPAELAAKLGE
jgi:FkbM family methyltransferase